MLKEGQYQFADGRIIEKPTKVYPTVKDFEDDVQNIPLEAVEFYADYFGWYWDNGMYGWHRATGELTGRIARAARAELLRRGKRS